VTGPDAARRELAASYGRWLRLLPPPDHARCADELLATYLDTAPAGASRPTGADRLDVVRYAARRWWHALGAPADVRPAASATVAWVLATALSYAAARSLTLASVGLHQGSSVAVLAPLAAAWALWPVVVVALLCGARRVAGVAAVVSAALGAGVLVGMVGDGARIAAVHEVGWVVAQGAVAVAALRAAGRPRRRVRVTGGALLVLGGALGVLTAAELTGLLTSPEQGLRLVGHLGVYGLHMGPSALVIPAAVVVAAVLAGAVERHALPPLAAVLAVLVVGRSGGLVPGSARSVPLTGLPLDASTLLPLLVLPLVVLVGVRLVVAAADRMAQPRPVVVASGAGG
jgi:hypothetical protein